MASADYVQHALKGIKKSFDQGSQYNIKQLLQSKIFNTAITKEWLEIFTSTESLSGVTELGERQTPPTLKLEEGYTVNLTPGRYGGAIEVTEEDMQRKLDNTTKVDTFLMRQRDRLLKANNVKLMRNIHLMLNEAFDSTSDYLAPDSVELCGTHTWNSGNTFVNELSTASKLTESAWDDVQELGGAFTDPEGEPYPLNFNTVVVKLGSDNERTAKRLFAMDIAPTAIGDINIYQNGNFSIVSTPWITSTNKNYWFALDLNVEASPLYASFQKMPSMNPPIRQNNEAIRSNVTGFYKWGINNMPYNLIGSTGSA